MAKRKNEDRERLEALIREYAIRETRAGRKARTVQERVHAKEVVLAHVIGTSEDVVYTNLSLDIGTHEGEQPYGDAIGIFKVTPDTAIIAAADIAVKSSDVAIGFMDRFKGTLILTGDLSEVKEAMAHCRQYFRETLGFRCCPLTES